jgi:predicted porin
MARTLSHRTAFSLALAMMATGAHAEMPKLTLGGFSDFHVGITNDDQDANARSADFANDNQISVTVEGKAYDGLVYGAVVDLEADTTADGDNQGENTTRTFTYLEGGWGRFEMGDVESVAATMRRDAETIAVALGGINGAWTFYVNGTVDPDGYLTTPMLVTEHGLTDVIASEATYNATKINYYSPKFSGFQAGLSYTPALNRGQTVNRTDNDAGDIQNIWDAGLGYECEIGALEMALAVTYEFGDAETASTEDTRAWNAGGTFGYQGLKLAGSYGDWSDSDAAAGRESDYWTLGAAYGMGAVGLSATYMESTREVGVGDSNEFSNLVLGADYKLAQGMLAYAETSFFEFDAGTNANDNAGTAVILGTQVAF